MASCGYKMVVSRTGCGHVLYINLAEERDYKFHFPLTSDKFFFFSFFFYCMLSPKFYILLSIARKGERLTNTADGINYAELIPLVPFL